MMVTRGPGLIRTKHPKLYFIIEDDINGKILFTEDLTTFRKIPYGWEEIRPFGKQVKVKNSYSPYGTTVLNLEGMKKIIDGLRTKIEKNI